MASQNYLHPHIWFEKLSAQKWLSEKSLLELMRTRRVIKGKMPENQSNSLLLMEKKLMGIFKSSEQNFIVNNEVGFPHNYTVHNTVMLCLFR